MKITVIYGTERKAQSTTYHLAQKVIQELRGADKVFEFFLPRDMNHFCKGCFLCFEGKKEKCKGYEQVLPIQQAMDASDLIIFTAPVYVYHVPGQLKALLDHLGWQWMVHQVNGKMFKKQGLIISTAAGAGMKSTIKDVKDSMDFWGIGRVYTYGKALYRVHWTELSEKEQQKMEEQILNISRKIKKQSVRVKTRLKVKCMFYGVRLMQKKIGLNEVDVKHWREKGFLDKERPWK